MPAHPKHPKCPECSKALYKNAPGKATAKKDDAWSVCRNVACVSFYGKASAPVAVPPVKSAPKPTKKPIPEPPAQEDKPKGKATAPKPPKPPREEHPAVASARVRIREILFAVIPGKFDKGSVGISLALVSQETGNHAAANALIQEYNLEEKYGITPVEIPAQK